MKEKLIILFFIAFYISIFPEEKNENNKAKNSNSSDTQVALVTKVYKDVNYRKTADESDWQKANIGLVLYDGNEVKTGFKSLALVKFTDGSGLLRVRENCILHIFGDKKEKLMNKNTFIQKGLISFDVKKQSENEEFKFTTPTVVASIRGTSGFLEYSEDSTFTMSLESGSALLNFTGPQGGEGTLTEGNTVTISKDGTFDFREQTDEDKKLMQESRRTNIKKIIIQTPQGDFEIEYYGPEE